MIYILAGILLALFILSRFPKIKGIIGEASVRAKLKKLNPGEYSVLHDLMIKQPNGKTSQIDHLVISRYGVFVIETKNYTGWIIGSEKAEYWTQVIYRRKERLYNPIRQNYGHIKALESELGDETIPFISIIAFSTRAELKLEPMSTEVIYSTQLLSTIDKYKVNMLTDEQKTHIHQVLTGKTNHTREERKQHINAIRNRVSDVNAKVSAGVCPKCEGRLVERRGRNGSFIGCSKYPQCRFTQNVR